MNKNLFPNKSTKFLILILFLFAIVVISGCESGNNTNTTTNSNQDDQTNTGLDGDGNNNNIVADNNTAPKINDTGVLLYSQVFNPRLVDDPKPTPLTSTPDYDAPGQDADKGYDANPDLSNNDGISGFKFTKLDSSGVALENQAVSYSTQQWHCVKDEITGLTWEVKTTSGLQKSDNYYTWYHPIATLNGGDVGFIGDNSTCLELENCNTSAYVDAINALNDGAGLCGSNNWRLPLREELRSLLNYSITTGPMIDANFFPNAEAADTWSSQTAFYNTLDGSEAWEVHFDKGHSEAHHKNSDRVVVRLVH